MIFTSHSLTKPSQAWKFAAIKYSTPLHNSPEGGADKPYLLQLCHRQAEAHTSGPVRTAALEHPHDPPGGGAEKPYLLLLCHRQADERMSSRASSAHQPSSRAAREPSRDAKSPARRATTWEGRVCGRTLRAGRDNERVFAFCDACVDKP